MEIFSIKDNIIKMVNTFVLAIFLFDDRKYDILVIDSAFLIRMDFYEKIFI